VTAGFVRAARSADAPGLARVQVASWRSTLADAVPASVLDELTSAEALAAWEARWLEAISNPPTSKHRVHVAVATPAEPAVLGFAAAGPATDDDRWPGTDGELYELHVLPALTQDGHDGRLLHAVADSMSEDGFHTAFTWALSADSARLDFLIAAGWGKDGTQSSLDMGVKVPMVRLHTRLSPAPA
jgi:ribosomal protein S18 acetylase RimI-like enzyme